MSSASDTSSVTNNPDYADNRPGQSALSYRVTSRAESLARMQAQLSRQTLPSGENRGARPLSGLSPGVEGEPSVALLDAWATVLDVISFYQERLIQESYLRTATESQSLRYLAHALAYCPSPAVAASTYLVLSIDGAAGMPECVTLPAGAQVMSVPSGKSGSLPQIFETSTACSARAVWNQLVPRLSQQQSLVASNQASAGPAVTTLRLQGQDSGLSVGMLLRFADTTTAQITAISLDNDSGDSEVSVQVVDGPALRVSTMSTLPAGDAKLVPAKLTEAVVEQHILGRSWDGDALAACIAARAWQESDVIGAVKSLRESQSGPSIIAYRQPAAFFGVHAPPWCRLPKLSSSFYNGSDLYSSTSSSWDESVSSGSQVRNKRRIWEDSWGSLYRSNHDCDVYLDRLLSGITAGSSVLLSGPRGYRSLTVTGTISATVIGYASSERCTGLKLSTVPATLTDAQADIFLTRDSLIHVQSESLSLTSTIDRLDDSPLSDCIELADLVLGLQSGQAICISGQVADQSGVSKSEIAHVAQVQHIAGYTKLYLSRPLSQPLVRRTVRVCANVVAATHGKSVTGEALGSGDASHKNQRFQLKQSPLTYLSAASSGQVRSTLALWVGGVLWQEVPSLLSQDGNSPCYVVERDDSGQATVVFGDGEHGARLPSGHNNIVASYRVGSGPDGEVTAGSLKLPLSRPLGLRGVENPLPASGAATAETLSSARDELPLSVATLGRAVSVIDYEQAAKAHPGIAKAQAATIRSAGAGAVHLTVASEDGQALTSDSALYQGLLKALLAIGEPTLPLFIDDYRPRYFFIDLRMQRHGADA